MLPMSCDARLERTLPTSCDARLEIWNATRISLCRAGDFGHHLGLTSLGWRSRTLPISHHTLVEVSPFRYHQLTFRSHHTARPGGCAMQETCYATYLPYQAGSLTLAANATPLLYSGHADVPRWGRPEYRYVKLGDTVSWRSRYATQEDVATLHFKPKPGWLHCAGDLATPG